MEQANARTNVQTKRESGQKTDINGITSCDCILNVFFFVGKLITGIVYKTNKILYVII